MENIISCVIVFQAKLKPTFLPDINCEGSDLNISNAFRSPKLSEGILWSRPICAIEAFILFNSMMADKIITKTDVLLKHFDIVNIIVSIKDIW